MGRENPASTEEELLQTVGEIENRQRLPGAAKEAPEPRVFMPRLRVHLSGICTGGPLLGGKNRKRPLQFLLTPQSACYDITSLSKIYSQKPA